MNKTGTHYIFLIHPSFFILHFPIEIIQTNKLSFLDPVQNSGGSLKMKAVGVRHAIADGVLNVNIAYEFSKGK